MASGYDVKKRRLPHASTALEGIAGNAAAPPVSLYQVGIDGRVRQVLSTASTGNGIERVGTPALDLVPKSAYSLVRYRVQRIRSW